MSDPDPEVLKDLSAYLLESVRVGELSDFDLISEVMETEVGDLPQIKELITRFRPEWLKEYERNS